ncbi:hypothetical protein LXA43DRAFT_1010139 [Ganoderma leucocontextum]|nr:hypothetical protein LXA43DRAFT_1010139 [Ganoderma leucocontextum]
MHPATSSAQPCSPWIPPELVSLILTKVWEAPHTPQKRSALLKNLALVNRTWLTLVACIASRDVHISNKRNANAFLRLLPKHSLRQMADDLFNMEGKRVANEVCRSLTFYVDGSTSPGALARDTSPASDAISLVLDTISALDHFPNLRHISLRYTDCPFDDVIKQLERGTFPQQVTHLSVEYAFTRRSLKYDMWGRWMKICTRHGRYPIRTLPPNLRHISFSGVTTGCAAVIVKACPNLKTLELTDPIQLSALVPFLSTVRTVVLHHPAFAASGVDMMAYPLFRALGRRRQFFPKGAKLRIVVRSGNPDPVASMKLRCRCRCKPRYNTELVYEP